LAEGSPQQTRCDPKQKPWVAASGFRGQASLNQASRSGQKVIDMRTNAIRYFAAALVAIVASATGAIAAGGTFSRGCAARDMQLMILVEASEIPASAKSDAVRAVLHARDMCFDGYVMDALSIYDKVAQSLAAEWALSSQTP
jgi:hypothetical protein